MGAGRPALGRPGSTVVALSILRGGLTSPGRPQYEGCRTVRGAQRTSEGVAEARGLSEAMLSGKPVTLTGYARRDGTPEMRIERIAAAGKTIELR